MESKIKLFPSYDICKFRLLLARAYVKEEKALERERLLMNAIEILSNDSNRLRFCKGCLEVTTEAIFSCSECDKHGCEDCNTKTKGVIACNACENHYCEGCDPLVLEDGLAAEPGEWTCTRCSS